ncbi:MAG: hypothetical protein PVH61_31660 [Candidatus Aminicenantes bacterium]|jgi:hypothetical protein
MEDKYKTIIVFSAIGISVIIMLGFMNGFASKVIDDSTTTQVFDYTGKAVQVNYVQHISSGLFSCSSREDTYVTFDNGVTYWKQGYHPIVEGATYHVHSVKTERLSWENGTVTHVENTFQIVELPQ